MKNPSDINLANILLSNIQEIAYEQATENAKKLWEGSRPWEWNDGEGERAEFEKAKEREIHNMFSGQLPNFEPTEFFDTTTEYSLERTVQHGIHLYLNQTSLAEPTSSSGDGLSARPPSLGNTGPGAEEDEDSPSEEDEDSPSEEEAGEYRQHIYYQEYSTLTRLLGVSEEEAAAEAQITAQEAFRAYLLGCLYRREREGGDKYIYESLRTGAIQSNAPTSSIGGSNKEGENIKISNEEAYALYLIYSGSDNSNVMPGIPLVNSPKEYQDNNNLFFKYMSKIINNTSISDSYHIATLINLKEEVKADDKSKIELAGETKKKINLESLIVDSRLPQEAPAAAAAAAAGGKKRKKRKTKKRRKKRKTKKRRKKNKKTISNSKYLSKKTKQKKRRKKKSLKN